ncbi:MAG: enoyl-CoA hydratase-related protein [Hyphomicrobiaceae bacterium]
MSDEVAVQRDGTVIEITLNRPPANALNARVSTLLYEAFRELNDDDGLRVGILMAGENERGIFSAGWDLKEVAQGEGRSDEEGFDLGPGGLGGLPEYWDLCKPVIAAVGGIAVGGGFEMALGADIICASDDAAFWLPEMQRGFLPDAGAIQKLHHIVPRNVAADLILTGRRMSANEAKHWGMVRDVVPKADLHDHVREVAATIAAGAPLVSKAYKEFMRAAGNSSPEDAHRLTRQAWVGKSGLTHSETMLNSEDFDEGSMAFAEKRPPVFKGR